MCFTERVEFWCSIKQTWGGALEQKMTINFAKTWADPGGGGREVDGQPPFFRTAHQKIYQNIIRGKTYQTTWLPKKSRRLPVTISVLDVICSRKVATL